MSSRAKLVAAGAGVAVVVAGLAVAVATAQKRPASCDASLREKIASLQQTGLALVTTTKAAAAVEGALSQADAVDRRFFLARRYDDAACAAAGQALAGAVAAVDAARRTKAEADALVAERKKRFDDAEAALAAATSFVATGLTGDALVRERARVRDALDDEKRAFERASGELSASGYEGGAAKLAATPAPSGDAAALRARAERAVLARCRLASLDARAVKELDGWLVVSGRGEAALAFVDGDAHTCRPVRRVSASKSAVLPGREPDETLRVWNIPGALVTTSLLVGWSHAGAWFASRDGVFRAFVHHRTGPGCLPQCPAEPTRGDGALSATCTCSDDTGGASTFTVRYAWDGHTVNFEP